MSTIIYKTSNCPKCQTLMAWLDMFSLPFDSHIINPEDASQISELRCNGCEPREAPILSVDGDYHPAHELFDREALNTKFLREIFGIPDGARGKADPAMRPYGDA